MALAGTVARFSLLFSRDNYRYEPGMPYASDLGLKGTWLRGAS